MAGVTMESTLRWVGWLVASFTLAALAVVFAPQLALWLPKALGY